MSGSDAAQLAHRHSLGDQAIPATVLDVAAGDEIELVWRNKLGGLTFRIGGRFIKWNPRATKIDLAHERDHLSWLAGRHPDPTIVEWGEDDLAQWLVTFALPGGHAVGDMWRARRPEAIAAIAAGLKALHAIAIDDFPREWTRRSWVGQQPQSLGPAPAITQPVLVHGDACAPNTLINDEGSWVGNVDFGDLAIGDKWADLAVASLSLDWNFGKGHQHEFFDAYGVEADEARIRYYRDLRDLAS